MDNKLLYFNGIDGSSGEYLLPPVSPRFLSKIIRGEKIPEDHLEELEKRQWLKTNKTYAPKYGVDERKLNQTGWGVIFARDADPEIKKALSELLDLRKRQATEPDERNEPDEVRLKYYREFIGEEGYKPEESKLDFLKRHGVGPGRVDPRKFPYYLLIVGSPEQIPYTFQYQLDVQFAVGRIHFTTLREYAQYARSVVEAESRPLGLARQVAFFGVQNDDDPATNLSATELVKPLAESVAKDKPDWKVQTFLQGQATKDQLCRLMGGAETPALLFTASHGMGFQTGDARQLRHQGALLCQEWPGPEKWRKAIPQEFYLSADDIADEAGLLGLLLFDFACYSAGTPRFDDFAHSSFSDVRETIAARSFVAPLPQRLLAHPKGGALAMVGHVDRAWGYSFMWEGAGRQLQDFESVLKKLMEGYPIGSAIEPFNERYAELSTSLNTELEEIKFRKKPNDLVLAEMWTASNDARDYTIIGDPAVRLAITDDSPSQSVRGNIQPITLWSKGETPVETVEPEALRLDELEREARTSEFSAGIKMPAGEVSFGISDTLGDIRDKLSRTLVQFSESLSQMVAQTTDNASSLQVTTYISDDLSGVTYERGRFTGNAKLCALTRINLDGDTMVCVPADEDVVNEELWKIHSETVHSAQLHRAEMLKNVISAATGLFSLFKA
jgi:hypothetical protein